MGIINFQGKRDKTTSKPVEQILVADYMTTKMISFKPDQSIHDVITLIKYKISGALLLMKIMNS